MRIIRRLRPRAGFTLLELIIVILIIGILAAVAIPTPHHDGIRARVSRVRSDQRSLATAIESFFFDHKCYPAMSPLIGADGDPERLKEAGGEGLTTFEVGGGASGGLTTPIAYINSTLPDPFAKWRGLKTGASIPSSRPTYAYYAAPENLGWILFSPGPDGDYDIADPAAVYDPKAEKIPSEALVNLTYDPTNGSISNGDVWRVKQ